MSRNLQMAGGQKSIRWFVDSSFKEVLRLLTGYIVLCFVTCAANPQDFFFTSMGVAGKCEWVCLKIGYTPNYSHLVGIMISKTIGFFGVTFSDTPMKSLKFPAGFSLHPAGGDGHILLQFHRAVFLCFPRPKLLGTLW